MRGDVHVGVDVVVVFVVVWEVVRYVRVVFEDQCDFVEVLVRDYEVV